MTEAETRAPPEREDMRPPRLRYAALSAWLQTHGQLLDQVFPEQRLLPGEAVGGPGPEGGSPRGVMVISGQLLLTQVLPGSVEPCKALYAGDVWVHPLGPSPAGGEALFPTHLVAETSCRVRVLSPGALASLPELEQLLRAYGELLRNKPLLFEALRRMERFRNVPARHLRQLIDLADVRAYQRGEFVRRQGDVEGQGVYLVLRGALAELEGPESGALHVPLALFAGDHFGDGGMHGHDEAAHTTSVEVRSEEALVALIPREVVERLSRRSLLVQRLRGQAPQETVALKAVSGPSQELLPEVVLFRSGLREGAGEWSEAALRGLVDRVAEGIRAEYLEAVLVVDVVPGPDEVAPRCPGPIDAQGRPVTHHRVHASRGEAVAGVLKALARAGQRWDYLFVRVAPALWQGLVLPEDCEPGFLPRPLGGPVWKLVLLASCSAELEAPPGFEPTSILFTVLLGRTPRREGRADPVGTVRLRVEPSRLARGVRLSELPPREQEALLRWGRAITERLVAVALGGGGSWGFAELAILQELVQRKVPVDLVSGTSFGALTAAFFCKQGAAGLQRLLNEIPRLTWVIWASILNSSAITRFVDHLNDGAHLEDLEIPCFPVSTNVSTSQMHVSRWGSLGEGVRASGALSGVFSPAFFEGQRLVDGGFIANVPAAILKTWRANLVVAINVVAQPPVRRDSKPLLPTRLGWFLHGLNPVERIIDVIRSMIIAFHTSGRQAAQDADVLIDCPFVAYSPGDYAHSREIMNAARQAARPAIEQVQRKWEELRLPRRERALLPPSSTQEEQNVEPDTATG